MVKLCDKVIIAIGSSQESDTERNPFTMEERKDMIQRVLQAEDLIPRYDIEFREVADADDDGVWVEQVLEQCGDIKSAWTGDEWTKGCFEKKGIDVRDIKEVPGLSATEVRQKIKDGDVSWKKMVHGEVVKFINEINGTERIK